MTTEVPSPSRDVGADSFVPLDWLPEAEASSTSRRKRPWRVLLRVLLAMVAAVATVARVENDPDQISTDRVPAATATPRAAAVSSQPPKRVAPARDRHRAHEPHKLKRPRTKARTHKPEKRDRAPRRRIERPASTPVWTPTAAPTPASAPRVRPPVKPAGFQGEFF